MSSNAGIIMFMNNLDFIPEQHRHLFFKLKGKHSGHYAMQCQECPSTPKVGNKKQVLSRIERDQFLGVCVACVSKSLRGKTLLTDEELGDARKVILVTSQRMENKFHVVDRICIECKKMKTMRVSSVRERLTKGKMISEVCWDCRNDSDIKLTLEGYIRVKEPTHPNAGNTGWVLQHRKVMSDALGRPLLKSETIHHINGDRTDNRLENLQLRQGDHGVGAVFRCLDCGSHNVESQKL